MGLFDNMRDEALDPSRKAEKYKRLGMRAKSNLEEANATADKLVGILQRAYDAFEECQMNSDCGMTLSEIREHMTSCVAAQSAVLAAKAKIIEQMK